MKTESNSFRHFPPDLFLLLGFPFFAIALLSSWLTSLHDWPWVAAFAVALLMVVLGVVELFRAKLPLYREGRFFTWGSRDLSPAAKVIFQRGCWLSGGGIFFAALLVVQSLVWRGF